MPPSLISMAASRLVFRCLQARSLSFSSPFRNVEFTSKRYPDVRRGSYASLTQTDVDHFKQILGDNRAITDASELEGPNTDWLKSCRGKSSLLLRPKTTEEVSKILAYCNEKHLAVCPQGGNTGLVGGSVPVFDEIILSMSLMNQIISFDDVTGILQCEAGCILENLEHYASERKHVVPIDLGAKGSCHIGGNVSTNAGGIRLFRYGSLLGNVLGLEVVLPSGKILDMMSPLRKDNTGYHLKHLFIGCEGTLGVITKVALLCPTKPNSTTVALLGCKSFQLLLQTFKVSKELLAENLLSFEMMDAASMDAVEKNMKMTNPISPQPFYIVMEVSGHSTAHTEERMMTCVEALMEQQLVEDGTFTSDLSKVQNLWALRERMAEALLHDGYCYKYDISLPLLKFYDIVEEMKKHVGDKVTRCCGYGHVGDGNIHFNITTPAYSAEITKLIEPYVFEWTSKNRGSISAEHGLGFKKRNHIHFSKSPECVDLMKKWKNLMDPNGILNPYKGEGCMSIQMVRRWRSWFLEGRQNVHDDEQSGRLVMDNAAVAAVRNVVEADRRVTIDEIMIRLPPGIEIGRSSIGTIMSDVLNFRKVCARWVPRLLSENHKQRWRQPELSWKCIEEMEINCFPKGVLLVDYLPPNTTVNAARYCEVLTKLRAAIKWKRPNFCL
ncbi:D2HGDH [Cordylochernes scorpioides]|uniref:D-2-hydroxyglutarate dehydrogenase, mitochondrial n=1 Tax=Cordylochernes scorpioides TaxID=51811 RepID=A0ABY6LS65_9ARAC|nr:D2HGDH [Cordylochernes scorpioides]